MRINKKKILLFSVVTLIFVIGLFVLFKNVNPKKIKGSVNEEENYEELASIGFKACIVNAYNKENNTNYAWDYDLTDEQLSTIKKLDCVGGSSIDSVKEKLESVSSYEADDNSNFYYFDNYEREIDEFNSVIDSIDLYFPTISIKGIEKLTNLEELYIYYDRDQNYDDSYEDKTITLPSSLKTFYLGTDNEITVKGAENLENLFVDEVYDDNYHITFESDLSKLKVLYSKNDETSLKINYPSLISLEEVMINLHDHTLLNNSPNLKKVILDRRISYPYKTITNFDEVKFWNSVEYLDFSIDDISNPTPLPDMPNVKTLIMRGYFKNISGLSNMPKIENLSVYELPWDLSNYSNTLKRIIIDDDFVELEDIKGIEKLQKLEYLYFPGLGSGYSTPDFSGFEKLTSLKELALSGRYSFKQNVPVPSLEKFAGQSVFSYSDYSIFPNLKYLITYNSSAERLKRMLEETGSINSSDNVYLEKLYLRLDDRYDWYSPDENFSWPKNIKLKTFYATGNEIEGSLLKEMKSLETLVVDRIKENEYDFSNNKHLKELTIRYNIQKIINYDQLTNLRKIVIASVENKTFDFSNLKDLSILSLGCTVPQKVDLSENVNLKAVALSNVYDLDLDKSKELRILIVDNLLGSLRVSNSNNLDYLYLKANTGINKFELVGSEFNINDYIQLPAKYKIINGDISDESLVQMENDKIIFKKPGKVSLTYAFYGAYGLFKDLDWKFGIGHGSGLDYTGIYSDITIFDVNLKNMKMNKKKGFILTNPYLKEKNIIKDIKYLSTETSMPYSVVDKDNLNILVNRNIIKKLKLIKVTSRKYDIKDNNIYYNGEFNIDNVKVTNANKNVNNDKLEVIFDNEVVKTYNLIKKENLIGDVNGDGKVSITDMSMQYKHVKYVLDLEGDYHYRADLNSDEDVSISDVSSLYKIIKRN